MKICGCRREWIYSGSSNVEASSFIVATSRKLRMGLDLDAGHDGFDIAAVIQQRREAGPALLAHPIAFVEDGDAAAKHGGHQRRGHVAQAALAFNDRA